MYFSKQYIVISVLPFTVFGYGQTRLYKKSKKPEKSKKYLIKLISIVVVIMFIFFINVLCMHRQEVFALPNELLNLLGNVVPVINDSKVILRYIGDNILVISIQIIAVILAEASVVPGLVPFLAIIGGYLYQFWYVLVVVSICTGIGSICCFYVSKNYGKKLCDKYLKRKIEAWSYTLRVE